MKKTILLCLTLLLSYSAISQRQTNGQRPGKINLSGKVIDQETQQPLEYATVTLRNDSRPELLQGGITTEDGSFSFEVFPGRYTIIIEYISFEKNIREGVVLREATDLGTVELSIATNSLDEVELVGERTEVEIRLDKRVYNVGKDITVRGGSVSDVMDNIPSVSVDVDGTISLRGNDNVRNLINGKPSGLVGLSGPDALRQLPAESIEKVEVITSPSARYEASGTAGILNIILKKQELEGFNGSFIANGGFPKTYGGSASLNWRTKKLNVFTTTSVRDSRSNSNGLAETDFTIPSDTIFSSKEKTTNERDNQNMFLNLGAEYYFDDNTSLVLSGFIRKSENTSDNFARTKNFFENNSLFNTILRNQLQTGEDNSRQFTANFDKKFNVYKRGEIYKRFFKIENDINIHTYNLLENLTEWVYNYTYSQYNINIKWYYNKESFKNLKKNNYDEYLFSLYCKIVGWDNEIRFNEFKFSDWEKKINGFIYRKYCNKNDVRNLKKWVNSKCIKNE